MTSASPIRIKALDQLEFDGAVSDGYIYGTLSQYVDQSWKTFYAFAWLGAQVNYKSTLKDDPNASYKKFVDCTVRVADTQKKLDAEKFMAEESGLVVIIYW
jgi:hypothetical protein